MNHDHRDDVEAELGYRQSSGRELRLRDWLAEREDPRRDPAFQRLVARLHQKNWRARNPEKYLDEQRRYLARVKEQRRELWRKWKRAAQQRRRARARARDKVTVYTCSAPGCGARWCRLPWLRAYPKSQTVWWCSNRCRERTRYRTDAGYRQHVLEWQRQARSSKKPRGPRGRYRCSRCGRFGHNRVRCEAR